MPRLPLPQATIDPARVLASAARVRQALFAAPVFADDAAEFGVTEASLDARLTRPFPGKRSCGTGSRAPTTSASQASRC